MSPIYHDIFRPAERIRYMVIYSLSIWPSEQDWSPAEGLTLLHLLGLGCVLVPVAYSLPVLFSRICPRLFPCSSHHLEVFLSIEGRNPFYPAKKAEPRIFWILEVFFIPAGPPPPHRLFQCSGYPTQWRCMKVRSKINFVWFFLSWHLFPRRALTILTCLEFL